MQLYRTTPLLKPLMFNAVRASPVLIQKRGYLTGIFIKTCIDLLGISMVCSVLRRSHLVNCAEYASRINNPAWGDFAFKYLDVGERCTEYCIQTAKKLSFMANSNQYSNSSKENYTYRNQSTNQQNQYQNSSSYRNNSSTKDQEYTWNDHSYHNRKY